MKLFARYMQSSTSIVFWFSIIRIERHKQKKSSNSIEALLRKTYSVDYAFFLSSFTEDLGFCGLDLPYDPFVLLPFLVLMSPLPIGIEILIYC